MTGATHMLVAGTIYKFVPLDKPAVLALALVSHFVLDAIPHYDLTKKANYILGIVVGFFVLITALNDKDAFLLIAAFLGALPDLNTLFLKIRAVQRIHNGIHFKYKIYNPWLSIGFELTFSTACILLLAWW